MTHRRWLWTLAGSLLAHSGFGFGDTPMPLEKPPRYQGPVQLIERLVVAYSPHSDWNGAFAQDLDMSHLIKTASDEGMEVVLFNVDKALKPAKDWDQREQMFLNKLTKTGRDKNSILIISTHGGTAKSNDQNDTTLERALCRCGFS